MYTNFVELETLMLLAKFQEHRNLGSREKCLPCDQVKDN